MVNQLYISYADGESTSVNHPIFLNISYIMVQSFKNAIVSPSSFCIFSILKFYLKFWIDRVEEGKQHRNHANKSEDATLRFGGKNVGSAKDLESRYSIILDPILMTEFPQSAALALDQSTLDVDQVENLIKFCPTKEEMELLKVHISTMLL